MPYRSDKQRRYLHRNNRSYGVSNTTRLIMVWGGLIALYLLVANRGGTATLLTGLSNFATGTTKTLQGR